MARLHTALLVLVLLAPAYTARADQPALREAARNNGYSAADIAAIEAPLDQAEQAGIPVEPLVKKAHEGVAKRAPAPLIVRVLNEQRVRALGVRDALPSAGREDGRVLQAALTATAAGADLAAIKSVGSAAGAKTEAAFYVLGVLCSGGVEAASAGAFVRAQLEAGLPPAEMESLSLAGVRAVRAGLASNADLGNVNAADLKNGGNRVLAVRLNGVRAGAAIAEPAFSSRVPVAERQAERNAETRAVHSADTPKRSTSSDAKSGDSGQHGDNTGGHEDDHKTDSEDEHDAPRSKR